MEYADAQSARQRLESAIAALELPRLTKERKRAAIAELHAVKLRLQCEESQRRKRK